MINKYLKIIIPLVVITIVLLPGCSSKNNNKEDEKPTQQSSQKPPEELKKMVSEIEATITETTKMVSIKNSTQQMKMTDTKSSQSNKSEQTGKSESKNSKTKSDPSEQQEKSWLLLETKSKDIHKNWNKLEPEVIKAGLLVSERKNFEAAMENLTISIKQKSEMNCLKSSVELYGQYSNLAKVFKSSIPADYHKTKYEIMAATIDALEGDWDKAANRITLLKDSWKSLKTQVKVKDDKLLNRSELSLDDFEAAVAGKNIDILIIKAEIALDNLQQIEKSISKSNNAKQE